MSMIDKLKGLLKGREGTAHRGVEKAGDMFDAKTQNKYRSPVDKAQQKINQQIGGQQPPPPGPR